MQVVGVPMQVFVGVDPDDPNDIEAGQAFLASLATRHIPPPATPVVLGDIEAAREDLRKRLSEPSRKLLQAAAIPQEPLDLSAFADLVGSNFSSVKGYFNSPFPRAFKNMQRAFPGVPSPIEWSRPNNRARWRFVLRPEWRQALLDKPLWTEPSN